jgi:hypothetical protein
VTIVFDKRKATLYALRMIKSFAQNGLEAFFRTGNRSWRRNPTYKFGANQRSAIGMLQPFRLA